MKEYPLKYSSNNWQLIRKYIKDLDTEVNSVMNLIDFCNPNYIVINKEYKERDNHFFSDTQLATLNIIRITSNNVIGINLNNLRNHWILINNWGLGPINIYSTELDNVPLAQLDEGFALYNNGKDTNGNIIYSIVSLDSSGAYYTLTSINSDNEYIYYNWAYYENAIDDIGSKYLFTFAQPVNRYIFTKATINDHDETIKLIQDFNSATVTYAYSYNENTQEFEPVISTRNGTFWTNSQVLGHDIITLRQDNYWEEVLCDEYSYNDHIVENHMPKARNVITTNLQSCGDVKFYINFY